MATIVTNPTPKQQFQLNNQNIASHRDMIASSTFEKAANISMLELVGRMAFGQKELPAADAAAANYYMMAGAQQFLFIMRNLGETVTAPERTAPTKLDYKA